MNNRKERRAKYFFVVVAITIVTLGCFWEYEALKQRQAYVDGYGVGVALGYQACEDTEKLSAAVTQIIVDYRDDEKRREGAIEGLMSVDCPLKVTKLEIKYGKD